MLSANPSICVAYLGYYRHIHYLCLDADAYEGRAIGGLSANLHSKPLTTAPATAPATTAIAMDPLLPPSTSLLRVDEPARKSSRRTMCLPAISASRLTKPPIGLLGITTAC